MRKIQYPVEISASTEAVIDSNGEFVAECPDHSIAEIVVDRLNACKDFVSADVVVNYLNNKVLVMQSGYERLHQECDDRDKVIVTLKRKLGVERTLRSAAVECLESAVEGGYEFRDALVDLLDTVEANLSVEDGDVVRDAVARARKTVEGCKGNG